MVEWVVLGGGILVVAVAVGLGIRHYRRRPKNDRPKLAAILEEKLGETCTTERTHLESSPRVRVRAGEGGVVTIVRVDLGTTGTPSSELVYGFVADILSAIHPELAAEAVDCYYLEFTFGPDGLLVSRSCRRVTVPAEVATRLCSEPTYRVQALQQDVKEGDKAVSWGECDRW